MKQQDVAILIIIVFVTGIFAFFISGKFISPSDKKEKAEVVVAITDEFNAPSADVFNSTAINPTVRIEIAPNNNAQPFSNEKD